MKAAAFRTVGTVVAERAVGEGPGRARALGAAMVAGVATAALTYRLLRG
jgi:hypothetical protein